MPNKSNILIPPNGFRKILLHSCCAPCSCEIMEILKENNIEYTVFFYNPNIDTEAEYNKRKDENKFFANKLKIPFIDGDYLSDTNKWVKSIAGFEGEPERGKRCSICFKMRLTAAAEFAHQNSFNVFTSSLGISRWKDFTEVCRCGIKAASKFPNVTYWSYNWRKKGGSERMSQISKRENFYRQTYCGCSFSKPNTSSNQ